MGEQTGTEDRDRSTLQTLARGAGVLDLLLERDAVTLKEVSQQLDLPTTVAHRLLKTWASLDYLRFDHDSKRYVPGLTLMRLAAKARAVSALPEVEDRLATVCRRTEQTASCAVLAGVHVLYVARALANSSLTYMAQVGKTSPAYATSMGHVLLAFGRADELERLYPDGTFERFTEFTPCTLPAILERLEQVRVQGYAVNRRQLTLNVSAVAVPLYNRVGEVVASISAAGPADRFTNDAIFGTFLPALLDAARTPIELRL